MTVNYDMAEFVSRPVRKITSADWLLNGPIVYATGPVQYTCYSGLEVLAGKSSN